MHTLWMHIPQYWTAAEYTSWIIILSDHHINKIKTEAHIRTMGVYTPLYKCTYSNNIIGAQKVFKLPHKRDCTSYIQ